MKFLLPLFAMLLVSCATDPNAQFSIENLTAKEREDYSNAKVILLGEQHDNPSHHKLQNEVLKSLAKQGRLKTVVFEQIDWTYQGTLAQLKADNFGRLSQNLNWKDSGWPDYAMYEDLFKTALSARAKIVAGGLPKNRVEALYKSGYEIAFNAAEIEKIKLRMPLDGVATELLRKEIFDGHCKMIPDEQVRKMIPIQRARDAALVKGYMNEADTSAVTVFILGNGHARKEFGVPSLLRNIDPTLKVWSVGIQEIGSDVYPDGAFDKVFITEKVQREDPCVSMKKHQDAKQGGTPSPAPEAEATTPETEAPAPETEAPAPETEAPQAEDAAPEEEEITPEAEESPPAAEEEN